MERFFIDLFWFRAGLGGILLQEVIHKERDVLGTLAERWHFNRDDR